MENFSNKKLKLNTIEEFFPIHFLLLRELNIKLTALYTCFMSPDPKSHKCIITCSISGPHKIVMPHNKRKAAVGLHGTKYHMDG